MEAALRDSRDDKTHSEGGSGDSRDDTAPKVTPGSKASQEAAVGDTG